MSAPSQLMLFPTGAGQARRLTHDNIDHIAGDWLPDSKHIVFSGTEPAHKPRVYLQAIMGGGSRPISPEGFSGAVRCSPDGKLIAVKDQQQIWLLPLDGGALHPVRGTSQDDIVLRWSVDGKSLYVTRPLDIPAKLWRVEISSGNRELIKHSHLEMLPESKVLAQFRLRPICATTATALLDTLRICTQLKA